MLYGRSARTGCAYVYDSSVRPTRTSLPPVVRTAPKSPSLPETIAQFPIRSHSPMSQNLPTRFQASAAGLFTTISSGMDTYVGCSTTTGTVGLWALAGPSTQTRFRAQAAAIVLECLTV